MMVTSIQLEVNNAQTKPNQAKKKNDLTRRSWKKKSDRIDECD